jgi:hypothetical protein
VESGRWHERYAATAAALAPGADTFLLIGFPRYLGRAPAFSLPNDSVLNVARAARRQDLDGGNEFALTRRGAFYINAPTLYGADAFRWAPRARTKVIGYSPGRGFECLADYHLQLPDGSSVPGAFDSPPACRAHADFTLKTALLSVRRGRSPAMKAAEVPWLPGIRLAGLRAKATANRLFLGIDWKADRAPGFSFVFIPRLVTTDGALAFEPVYGPWNSTAPLLWPLVNDELPAASWRAGETVHEEYGLELERPLPAGTYRLFLTFYRLSPRATLERLGTLEVPVAI